MVRTKKDIVAEWDQVYNEIPKLSKRLAPWRHTEVFGLIMVGNAIANFIQHKWIDGGVILVIAVVSFVVFLVFSSKNQDAKKERFNKLRHLIFELAELVPDVSPEALRQQAKTIKGLKYRVTTLRVSKGTHDPIWEVWVERPGGKSFMFNEKYGICHEEGPRQDDDSPVIEIDLDAADVERMAQYIDNQDRIVAFVFPGESRNGAYSDHQSYLDDASPQTIDDLEKLLIPPEQWEDKVPYKIKQFLNRDEKSPVSTGRHPIIGWYIIESTGQGPYMIWHEAQGYDALQKLITKNEN